MATSYHTQGQITQSIVAEQLMSLTKLHKNVATGDNTGGQEAANKKHLPDVLLVKDETLNFQLLHLNRD